MSTCKDTSVSRRRRRRSGYLVGVGTPSPTARLDIVTSTGLGVALGIDFAAREMAIRFKRGGVYLGDIYKAQDQRISSRRTGRPTARPASA